MKSLKDYSLNISEEQYHDDPAWSHSKIVRYAREGFSALATLHERIEPTPSMRFGSLFDAMITHDKVDDYVIYDKDIPPARKAVLDRLVELSDKNEFSKIDERTIRQALEDCDYKAAKKYETQYEHLEEFAPYFDIKKAGKKMVSRKDWEDAAQMAYILKTDPYHSTLFNRKSGNGVEYLYQLQFKVRRWIGDDLVDVKIMPDLLIVNHNEMTIQPVDLKTSTCPAHEFWNQFIKFRYDIQAAMYADVLQIKINSTKEYRDYRILPYIFSDISRSDMVPVSYVYPQDDESQRNGLSFGLEKTFQYKDWKILLREILDYEASKATVPNWLTTEGPNDILSILNTRRNAE